MIPVLLIITLIIFFGMRLIPGDPALLLVGNRASDEVIEAMRTRLGLSEPIYVQYFLFLKQCLTFNFGNSLTLKSPVSDLFRQKAVITVSLTLMTALFSVLISFPLGYISGVKHNSKIGSFIDSCSLTFIFHSECMRCIIDYFQTIFIRNLLNLLHIAYISIYMNRHDCTGSVCDQAFDLICIHRKIIRPDITEYRCQSISHDSMSC